MRCLKNPPTPALAKAGAAPGTTGGVEPALSRPWPSHSSNQTLPQAFPRQLSQLHAPDNPSNPSASLSKATLAATGPRQCFKPFRRPFQGNSRSYRPQPSVFKHVQDCRLPAFKPQKKIRPGAKNLCKSRKRVPRSKKNMHPEKMQVYLAVQRQLWIVDGPIHCCR